MKIKRASLRCSFFIITIKEEDPRPGDPLFSFYGCNAYAPVWMRAVNSSLSTAGGSDPDTSVMVTE